MKTARQERELSIENALDKISNCISMPSLASEIQKEQACCIIISR